jgi:hypothetical protein
MQIGNSTLADHAAFPVVLKGLIRIILGNNERLTAQFLFIS